MEWTPEIDIVPAMARVTDILTPGTITATTLCSSATGCLCYATKILNRSLVAVRSGGRHTAPNRDFRQKI